MATSITRLPVETIGDVLRRLDSFSTLAVCIRSSPVFWRAFRENSQVCRDILRFRIGLALLPYAIAVYEARHRRDLNAYTEDDTRCLLDTLYTDPASISRRLSTIDADGLKEIDRLHSIVQRSAREMAARALSVIEPGSEGIEADRISSTSELHRLCLALYRVELYIQLFGANGNPEAQPSFELRKSWFFDRHPAWVNEQLACVHDFLEWKLSHSLHYLTLDGKDFDESFLDRRPRGVDNHWMQCYISCGLIFIDDLENAKAYRTKIQLLLNAIGSGTARLAESLKSLSKDASNNDQGQNCASPKDDPGPFIVWSELHKDETGPKHIFLDSTYNLRKTAYVFWDEARIRKEDGVLSKRFQGMIPCNESLVRA